MNELPRSTRALLALLPQVKAGPVLDIGSEGAAVARETGGAYLHLQLSACESARRTGVETVFHADTIPDQAYGTICFDAREYEPAMAAEVAAQAAIRLQPDGVFLTTARPVDVTPYFAEVVEVDEALVARSPVEGAAAPAWPVYEVPFGDRRYRIQSAPGVFSPRGLDAGTRIMLGQIQVTPGARFLDLGCGTGVVSRIASEAWQCQVTAVDVNARALRLAALNAPQAEVLASDGLRGLTGRQFDVIASNPPYHTDFAVAKAFVEGAFAHLPVGGVLYLVVKRADWYVRKVREVFGGCRLFEEEEYTVITAEKRAARKPPVPPAAPATTKKHAKRLAAASGKKRRP